MKVIERAFTEVALNMSFGSHSVGKLITGTSRVCVWANLCVSTNGHMCVCHQFLEQHHAHVHIPVTCTSSHVLTCAFHERECVWGAVVFLAFSLIPSGHV